MSRKRSWRRDHRIPNLCIYIFPLCSHPQALAISCQCQPVPSRDVHPHCELSMLRACMKEWPAFPRKGLPFLLYAARARRTLDPSFLPGCFSCFHRSQKLLRTDNSSRPSFTLLVSAPPGWNSFLQAVTCPVEPLGRRRHP